MRSKRSKAWRVRKEAAKARALIEQGTSSAEAVLVDRQGRVLVRVPLDAMGGGSAPIIASGVAAACFAHGQRYHVVDTSAPAMAPVIRFGSLKMVIGNTLTLTGITP